MGQDHMRSALEEISYQAIHGDQIFSLATLSQTLITPACISQRFRNEQRENSVAGTIPGDRHRRVYELSLKWFHSFVVTYVVVTTIVEAFLLHDTYDHRAQYPG